MFLPASGRCYFDEEADWDVGGYQGYYWSSKWNDEDYYAFGLCFLTEDGISVDYDYESGNYFSCRLVRE